jgi:peptidoglycan/LPS O-acetylase OafA/YrhL
VDFFFVLSGFVMHKAYSDQIKNLSDLGSFFLARFARLWPLHIFIMFAFAILYVVKEVATSNSDGLGGNDTMTRFEVLQYATTDMFLLNALRPSIVYFWNFPTWSISAEVFCYLIFAAICLIPSRYRLLAVVGVLFFSWGTVSGLFPVEYGNIIFGAWSSFFIGYLASTAHRDKQAWSFKILSIVEALICFLIAAVVLGMLSRFVIIYLSPVIFGMATYVFAVEGGFISRFLSWRPFVLVGTFSYSIYMIHVLIFALMKYLMKAIQVLTGDSYFNDVIIAGEGSVSVISLGSKYFMDIITFSCLLFIVLVSSLTFRFIENPSRNYLREVLPNKAHQLFRSSGMG